MILIRVKLALGIRLTNRQSERYQLSKIDKMIKMVDKLNTSIKNS